MNKSKSKLSLIYTIHVEEINDYYFRPEGVLFVDDQQRITLYCSDVRHNFLRSVIQKFSYEELEKGVLFREHQFDFKNITVEIIERFGDSTKAMLPIIQEIYNTSPRQYYFLKKVLEGEKSHPHQSV